MKDPVEAPAFPPRLRKQRLKDECGEKARDLFHKWAKLPDYEPLDEDLAINLVGSIRDLLFDELVGQHAVFESEVGKLKAENERLRTFWERIGDFTFKSRSLISSRKPTHVSLEIALIEKELKESP